MRTHRLREPLVVDQLLVPRNGQTSVFLVPVLSGGRNCPKKGRRRCTGIIVRQTKRLAPCWKLTPMYHYAAPDAGATAQWRAATHRAHGKWRSKWDAVRIFLGNYYGIHSHRHVVRIDGIAAHASRFLDSRLHDVPHTLGNACHTHTHTRGRRDRGRLKDGRLQMIQQHVPLTKSRKE